MQNITTKLLTECREINALTVEHVGEIDRLSTRAPKDTARMKELLSSPNAESDESLNEIMQLQLRANLFEPQINRHGQALSQLNETAALKTGVLKGVLSAMLSAAQREIKQRLEKAIAGHFGSPEVCGEAADLILPLTAAYRRLSVFPTIGFSNGVGEFPYLSILKLLVDAHGEAIRVFRANGIAVPPEFIDQSADPKAK